MIKAIIFDFDGTLVNTLFDLQDSINEALTINGYDRQYSYDETMYLIGSGTRVLCKRAINYIDHSKEDEEQLFSDFTRCYQKNQLNKTRPYSGVVDTLRKIKDRGIKIAILSNKVHENTTLITNHLFDIGLFDKVVGQKKNVPLKPDPTSLNLLIEDLGITKEEVLYVGDSDTDMKTANNAGVKKVAVTYGYRSKKELEQFHPNYLINSFSEILDLI